MGFHTFSKKVLIFKKKFWQPCTYEDEYGSRAFFVFTVCLFKAGNFKIVGLQFFLELIPIHQKFFFFKKIVCMAS